jgi:hypothetical protein
VGEYRCTDTVNDVTLVQEAQALLQDPAQERGKLILKDPEHYVINEREERSAYTAKELDT